MVENDIYAIYQIRSAESAGLPQAWHPMASPRAYSEISNKFQAAASTRIELWTS